MTLDERRRRAQLRPWTRGWDDYVIRFTSPIKPDDIGQLEICTHIDPETGERTWESLDTWGRKNGSR
jgi:hypothetical protein